MMLKLVLAKEESPVTNGGGPAQASKKTHMEIYILGSQRVGGSIL
jgi:hypothetical protein